MRILSLFIVVLLMASSRSRAQLPAVQAAVAGVNLDSLTHFVRQLTGETPVVINGAPDTIRSRQYQHPGNEKAFRFLREKMRSYGLSLDSVMVGARKSLIATLPGITPNAYMIGGHYDCVGTPAQPFAGADDDASGCAGVIEAARILSAMPQLPATVRFAFWDEEELGLLGSKDYTMMVLNPALHRGYINLDMIGYDGNNDSLIELYTAPKGSSQALADLAQTMPPLYNIGLQIERIDPGTNNSDYGPFWDLNYTAIGLAEDLAGDRNPAYHQAGDSLSKINLPYFRKLTQLAISLLAHSAITDAASIPPGGLPAADFMAWSHGEGASTILHFRAPERGELRFQLIDAGGRIVHQQMLNVVGREETVPLNNASLAAGIYLCRAAFKNGNGRSSQQYIRIAVLPR